MSLARILARTSRCVLVHCNNCTLASSAPSRSARLFANRFHSLSSGTANEASTLQHLLYSTPNFQRSGIFTSASSEPNEKKEQENNAEKKEDNVDTKIEGAAAEEDVAAEEDAADKKQESGSDSESSEGDLADFSKDDLVKLVNEKVELLATKDKEIAKQHEKLLLSYADLENGMSRARREAENSKKFAIQNFAKGLLDVADNLSRASSVVKDSFAKIDVAQDSSPAVPLLKTLLEGVEMTEKQLLEVFRKFGVEKYDPTNEQFDPNRHNAVFQVPDNSKPAETVAVVLKAGYTLHDRVIRPAEVGVTQGGEDAKAN